MDFLPRIGHVIAAIGHRFLFAYSRFLLNNAHIEAPTIRGRVSRGVGRRWIFGFFVNERRRSDFRNLSLFFLYFSSPYRHLASKRTVGTAATYYCVPTGVAKTERVRRQITAFSFSTRRYNNNNYCAHKRDVSASKVINYRDSACIERRYRKIIGLFCLLANRKKKRVKQIK